MKGAIICGYPGIGKSTLASPTSGYIDLESGNFWCGVERDKYWHMVYCNLAIHFAKQGYRVFVSSHEVIRNHLSSLPRDPDVQMVVCFPAQNLEAEWINKLFVRWCSSPSDKNMAAWQRACRKYRDDIKDLINQEGFTKIVIEDMRYDLESILYDVLTEMGGDDDHA